MEDQKPELTPDFKFDVAIEAIASGKTVTQVADERHLLPFLVGRWKKRLQVAGPGLFVPEAKREKPKADKTPARDRRLMDVVLALAPKATPSSLRKLLEGALKEREKPLPTKAKAPKAPKAAKPATPKAKNSAKPATPRRGGPAPKKFRLNGQLKSLREHCEDYGINIRTVRARLNAGWTRKEAITTLLMR